MRAAASGANEVFANSRSIGMIANARIQPAHTT
jgi:hypothetical protein